MLDLDAPFNCQFLHRWHILILAQQIVLVSLKMRDRTVLIVALFPLLSFIDVGGHVLCLDEAAIGKARF